MPLKAPPNIFGLICPYHQFPTKATWLVHLQKKTHHLEITHPQGVQQTWRPPICNQNAKDKTTQVAARVMLKYAIVRDGLEAFERPTIAGQKRIHGERFPLTTLGCSKLRRHRTFPNPKNPKNRMNLMEFDGLSWFAHWSQHWFLPFWLWTL